MALYSFEDAAKHLVFVKAYLRVGIGLMLHRVAPGLTGLVGHKNHSSRPGLLKL